MNNIEKIFAQLDRISRKLEYMGQLLDAFDENGNAEESAKQPADSAGNMPETLRAYINVVIRRKE